MHWEMKKNPFHYIFHTFTKSYLLDLNNFDTLCDIFTFECYIVIIQCKLMEGFFSDVDQKHFLSLGF